MHAGRAWSQAATRYTHVLRQLLPGLETHCLGGLSHSHLSSAWDRSQPAAMAGRAMCSSQRCSPHGDRSLQLETRCFWQNVRKAGQGAQGARGLLGASARHLLPGQCILNHLSPISYTRIAIHTLHTPHRCQPQVTRTCMIYCSFQ